ncbi:hypothetical protein M8J75_015946 [Diaphorina citri]|nr:hypothetical protein M8J75_015946 [Diaphorina citri]
MKDHLICLLALLSLTESQRIPQSFFPLRQDVPTSNASHLPPSYLPSPPNYDIPRTANQPGSQPMSNAQAYQTALNQYQPIPYTPHEITAFTPVQNLNQIGSVDRIPSYQSNPFGNDRPESAVVPIVNDPTVVQIAQYSNPQVPDIFRNSLITPVPNVPNQGNYNLITPNGQGPNSQGNFPSGGNPNLTPNGQGNFYSGGNSNQSPLNPSSYSPTQPNNGGPTQGVSFQPFNPYVGLFNETAPQGGSGPLQNGFPQQLPHFSYPNGSLSNANEASGPFANQGQGGVPPFGRGWSQSANGQSYGPNNAPFGVPSVPPLKVPQLPTISYNPPQLPHIPPDVPTPPPHLFVPSTLAPQFPPPPSNSLPLSPPFTADPPGGLVNLASEEIPWDEDLLSNGNIQHRSSEMSQPLRFDVASFLSLILPGTKWCGDGNRAKHDDELGSLLKTDRCCRKHDFCFDSILPRQTKYNLTNNGPFVR